MRYANNPAEIADIFRRDGIVVLDAFFSPDQARALAAELDAIVAAHPNQPFGGGPNYARERETRVRIYPGVNRPLAEAANKDPRLLDISLAILGPNYITGHVAMFSTARDGCQAWHQDSRSRHPEHFELNRIIFPAAVEPAQGALYAVPGSHLGPDLPRGGNTDLLPGQIECVPTAGTLILMHTRCFHRVGLNTTDRPRTQCNCRARPAAAKDHTLIGGPVFRTGPWNFSTDSAE